ncbi:MAG TPA: extracellular solute-binding protein [Jatrophihabitans sp.]|jgi:multiple sugar transport system substrate-binding protein
MRARTLLATLAVATLAAGAVSACSSSGGGSSNTITVAYEKFGSFTQMDQLMRKVKAEYEKANPKMSVKLEPIQADENDYYTKLDLMNRSASTAPDVLYEDTFLVNSDISAGYLQPLDQYLNKWKDWSQFSAAAKTAGKALDGKTYGVPMGTDTRGLYYNKQIFARAGLPTNWQPKSWNDILTAARTIKKKVPGVIPFQIYSAKSAGEGATMQGLEMLLYGTHDTLYDNASKKWIVSSKGLTDSFNFLHTVFAEGLGPSPQQELDTQWGTKVSTQLIPQSKIAIDLDGSWQTGNWKKTGQQPWPQYSKVLGTAMMPTEDGSAPGSTSMSGGWLLSVGAHAKNPQAAFDFIATSLNRENALSYDNAASQIAERSDVANDPSYKSNDPFTPFFTGLVKYTHFRPAYAQYPKVSDAIQTAMEAVMTNQSSVGDALNQLASTVKSEVGDGATTAK